MGTVSEELSKLEDERGWREGRIVEELESVDGEPKLLVRDLVTVRHFDEEAVQQSRSDC